MMRSRPARIFFDFALGRLTVLFALSAGGPAAAEPALEPPPTLGPSVLVLPFEGLGRPIGDLGYVLQLRAIGTVRALGGLGEIHQKMENRVVQQAEARLSNLSEAERAAWVARSLGAKLLVHGTVDVSNDRSKVTLEVTPVGTQKTESVAFEAPSFEGVSESLPGRLSELLVKVGATGKPISGVPVSPSSANRNALLQYAGCSRVLLEQPIGLLHPVVLDKDTLSKASTLCATAVTSDRAFFDAEATQALVMALQGRTKKAEEKIKKLLGMNRFHPDLSIAKFWVLSQAYGTEYAIESLEKDVHEHPEFLLGRGYLGDAWSAVKSYDRAIEAFKSYLEAVPDQPWVMARIGYNYSKKGDFSAGISWTEKALAVVPSDPEILLELGSRLVDAGRTQDAIAVFKRLVAEGNARGEVYLRLGYAHLLQGEYAPAERAFHESIRLATSPADWRTRGRARYDLAKLWMRFDNPDHALLQLEEALAEGFRDVAVFRSDPDLAKLASNPKFRDLMSRAKSSPRRPDHLSPFEVDPLTGAQDPSLGSSKRKPPF